MCADGLIDRDQLNNRKIARAWYSKVEIPLLWWNGHVLRVELIDHFAMEIYEVPQYAEFSCSVCGGRRYATSVSISMLEYNLRDLDARSR